MNNVTTLFNLFRWILSSCKVNCQFSHKVCEFPHEPSPFHFLGIMSCHFLMWCSTCKSQMLQAVPGFCLECPTPSPTLIHNSAQFLSLSKLDVPVAAHVHVYHIACHTFSSSNSATKYIPMSGITSPVHLGICSSNKMPGTWSILNKHM